MDDLQRETEADRRRLEALERFHTAHDVVEDGVLDFDLHHEAVTELREAHHALHPAALATAIEALELGPDVTHEPSCPSCGRLRYCDLDECGWYPREEKNTYDTITYRRTGTRTRSIEQNSWGPAT
jgi:hypothetical protein